MAAAAVRPAIDPVGIPNNTLLPLTIRLDRSNFSYWRALVLAAVRAYNLEGYILGTIPTPPPFLAGNDPNPAFQNWIRLDQFLTHWLFNSMTEMMLGHVLRCQSSAEIWMTLNQLFANQSKARILQIKGLLQSTRKGSLSIDEYISKMRNYAESLAYTGEALTDESLCLYILNGLGPECEATVVNLTNRSETLTLTDLHFSLHNQEMRLQHTSSQSIDSIQANFANLSMRGAPRGSSRGNRGGGSRGSRNNGSGQRSQGRGPRVVCQLCGRTGHLVQKCFHRFDVNFAGLSAPPAPNAPSPTESPNANLSELNSSEESSDAWFLDSGATNHMTNNS